MPPCILVVAAFLLISMREEPCCCHAFTVLTPRPTFRRPPLHTTPESDNELPPKKRKKELDLSLPPPVNEPPLPRGVVPQPSNMDPSNPIPLPRKRSEDTLVHLIVAETLADRLEGAVALWQEYIQSYPTAYNYVKFALWAEREAHDVPLARSVYEQLLTSGKLKPRDVKQPTILREWASFEERQGATERAQILQQQIRDILVEQSSKYKQEQARQREREWLQQQEADDELAVNSPVAEPSVKANHVEDEVPELVAEEEPQQQEKEEVVMEEEEEEPPLSPYLERLKAVFPQSAQILGAQELQKKAATVFDQQELESAGDWLGKYSQFNENDYVEDNDDDLATINYLRGVPGSFAFSPVDTSSTPQEPLYSPPPPPPVTATPPIPESTTPPPAPAPEWVNSFSVDELTELNPDIPPPAAPEDMTQEEDTLNGVVVPQPEMIQDDILAVDDTVVPPQQEEEVEEPLEAPEIPLEEIQADPLTVDATSEMPTSTTSVDENAVNHDLHSQAVDQAAAALLDNATPEEEEEDVGFGLDHLFGLFQPKKREFSREAPIDDDQERALLEALEVMNGSDDEAAILQAAELISQALGNSDDEAKQ